MYRNLDIMLDYIARNMNYLKTALKSKLDSISNADTLEALPRCTDIVSQSKLIDSWNDICVKKALDHERSKMKINKSPLFKPNFTRSKAKNLKSMVRGEARLELQRKRDLLNINSWFPEIKLLEDLFCINSKRSFPPSPLPSYTNATNFVSCFEAGHEYAHIQERSKFQINIQGYLLAISQLKNYLKLNGCITPHYSWIVQWFTTELFAKLSKGHRSSEPLVPVYVLMEYLVKKLETYKLRVDLMEYDTNGTGYLSKEDLWNHLLPILLPGSELNNNFLKSFLESVVAKIFFQLDPQRRQRVKISELLGFRLHPVLDRDFLKGLTYQQFSSMFAIFHEVCDPKSNLIAIPVFYNMMPHLCRYVWENNFEMYRKEIRFLPEMLTRMVYFYEKKFDRNNLGISFTLFLEMIWAWEHLKRCYSSIKFFFRILDTDDKGYLDETDLVRHLKAIETILQPKVSSRRVSSSLSQNKEKPWLTPSFVFVQWWIKEFLEREGLSRLTPKNLHNSKDGHIFITYLMNVDISLNNTLKLGAYDIPNS